MKKKQFYEKILFKFNTCFISSIFPVHIPTVMRRLHIWRFIENKIRFCLFLILSSELTFCDGNTVRFSARKVNEK